MSMRAKPWDVSDGLWERIEPLLPRKPRRFRYPGGKPFDDRLALRGILFVLHTGIGWGHLSQELGFRCGMTALRPLRVCQDRGGRRGRRRRALLADRGSAHTTSRRLLCRGGISPLIANRQSEQGSGLGRDGWVVERTFAWLHNRRRLLLRTDRRDDIHESFLA